MSIIHQFAAVLQRYTDSRTRVVVGVSGGSDSIVLLDMLHRIKMRNVIVAHLNHQLRKESLRDAEFVEEISRKFGYQCICESVDIKKLAIRIKRGIEETARIKRYEFFERVCREVKAKWVITAHHLDDQVETIIMNMIRGSGIDGLSGIGETSGRILRPLLGIKKSELIMYARKHHLKWREDRSNTQTEFTRNYIRKRIIPDMMTINPSLAETLDRMSGIFSEVGSFLKTQARQFIMKYPQKRYDTKSYMALPQALQSEIIRQVYQNHHGNTMDLSQAHMNQIQKMLTTNGNKQKEFGKGAIIKKTTHYFTITSL